MDLRSCQHAASGLRDSGVTHLDGLCIKTKALLLVGQEVLDILALISLELDDLTHLGVSDYGSIAGELLLDDLEDLLLVELLGQALYRGQGLTSIALCSVLAKFVPTMSERAVPYQEGKSFRGLRWAVWEGRRALKGVEPQQ